MPYRVECPSCKHRNEVDEAAFAEKVRCHMCRRVLKKPRELRQAEKQRAQMASERRREDAKRSRRGRTHVTSRSSGRSGRKAAAYYDKPRSKPMGIWTLFNWASHVSTIVSIVLLLFGGAVAYEVANPTVRPMIFGSGGGGSPTYDPFYRSGSEELQPGDKYYGVPPETRRILEQTDRINEYNRQTRERQNERLNSHLDQLNRVNEINRQNGRYQNHYTPPQPQPYSPPSYSPPSPFGP